jgi:lipopolysaccharide/colanic/teichoic acid biosynthesis glycosyltransferase
MTQRLFDILLATLALLVLSPLLVPVALILRFTGEGEVFFLQERVGQHGKLFNLYKFATMLKNSPSMGTGTVTLRNDLRILPVGHFLRKTKINELPQLLNVLKGNMSIIGPRPQTQRCFDAFSEQTRRTIIKVRPGLSGIGSIIFRYEEEMMQGHQDPDIFYDHVIMPYKGEIEEWYVENQNRWTYFILIGLTIWVILFPRSKKVLKLFDHLPKPGPELISSLQR